MRYEKGRKDTTRSRIVEVATEQFRSDGIAATGLAGIMNEAGLTNGAFYPHFQSKAALVRECVSKALEDQSNQLQEAVTAGGVDAVIDVYLSAAHRDNPGKGCASAALLPELARAASDTRQLYTERLLTLARRSVGSASAAEQGPGASGARHSCDAHRRPSAGSRRRRDGTVGSYPRGGEGSRADAGPAKSGGQINLERRRRCRSRGSARMWRRA